MRHLGIWKTEGIVDMLTQLWNEDILRADQIASALKKKFRLASSTSGSAIRSKASALGLHTKDPFPRKFRPKEYVPNNMPRGIVRRQKKQPKAVEEIVAPVINGTKSTVSLGYVPSPR